MIYEQQQLEESDKNSKEKIVQLENASVREFSISHGQKELSNQIEQLQLDKDVWYDILFDIQTVSKELDSLHQQHVSFVVMLFIAQSSLLEDKKQADAQISQLEKEKTELFVILLFII